MSVTAGGTRFEVEMRFCAGKTYCCVEPGCMLPTHRRDWWRELREGLREVSNREPPSMSILIRGVIETGVVVDGLGTPRMIEEIGSFVHGPVHEALST
ncbi:hypothetical protein PHYC_02254 [Phycisphaerales bacterium]|nr:hypothetical protein PHYC_02254 [Phycisphaerales bacterium]